jgi:hypothetical protein
MSKSKRARSSKARSAPKIRCKAGIRKSAAPHHGDSVFLVCLLGKPPYVAGPHPRTRKHVPRHFRDGFGQFPFLHGNPLSNQFDGSMLVGFVRKKIPYETRFSLGI